MPISGSDEGNNRAIPDFEAAPGKKIFATLLLKEDELKQGDYEKKLQELSEAVLKLAEC